MTPADRDLLEKAAKAAGYEVARIGDDGDSLLLVGVQDPWRPHRDDGDALRLAVKLHVAIDIAADNVCVWIQHFDRRFSEPCNGDVAAALRRAIVRAAAAIGETL
jgi:hypothetical protein